VHILMGCSFVVMTVTVVGPYQINLSQHSSAVLEGGLQASWALRLERLIDCCLGGLITVIAAAVDHHAWVGLHEQLSWMGWCSTNPSITHSNNQIHLAIGMNGGCFTHPIRIVAAPLC
jgi:hypothetical protein